MHITIIPRERCLEALTAKQKNNFDSFYISFLKASLSNLSLKPGMITSRFLFVFVACSFVIYLLSCICSFVFIFLYHILISPILCSPTHFHFIQIRILVFYKELEKLHFLYKKKKAIKCIGGTRNNTKQGQKHFIKFIGVKWSNF